ALTQKLCCPAFTATVTMDASGLKAGDEAGLALVGGQYAFAAVRRTDAGMQLAYAVSEGSDHHETVLAELPLHQEKITLRMTLTPTGFAEARTVFAWSLDGEHFEPIGEPFAPARHTWVGVRLTLFAMPMGDGADQGGYADFGAFDVQPLEVQP
ncbi:MAG: hypothetical protein ACI4OY_06390, partial [Aristaeellaceae bacterium]